MSILEWVILLLLWSAPLLLFWAPSRKAGLACLVFAVLLRCIWGMLHPSVRNALDLLLLVQAAWIGLLFLQISLGERVCSQLPFLVSALAIVLGGCCFGLVWCLLALSLWAGFVPLFVGILISWFIFRHLRKECIREEGEQTVLLLKEDSLARQEANRRKLQTLQESHVQTLERVKADLLAGKSAAALALLQSTGADLVTTRPVYYTSRMAVNGLLVRAAEKAQAENVAFQVECQPIPKSLRTIDLCLLLSNLLSNVLRAAKTSPDGTVSLTMLRGKDAYMIICTNSCLTHPSQVPHGQGLGKTILKEVLEACHGQMESEWKDGSYRVRIFLPVRAW